MVAFKKYILLFGGFQDTSQQTKYLADLWIYDTQNFVWYNPNIPLATQKPDARSSFTFLPHDAGAVLYGGYSRVKATVSSRQTKGGGGQATRNVLKPLVHQDCFYLRVTPPGPDAAVSTPPTVRWDRRKRPANCPTPSRAGATMAFHKGRGIMFGGVHDVEESEEGIDSEFFNNLFAWNIERNRFFPLALRKPRAQTKARVNERGARRLRGQANEEELLRTLAALDTGKSLEDVDMDARIEDTVEIDTIAKQMSMDLPHPRFNAQLAVLDDVLYIYGGTFEKGDREFTFDEMYAIDLVKLDGVKEIFRREPENWLGSEDEDSEEDEEDSEMGEDSDEGSEEEVNATQQPQKTLFTESKRLAKRKDDTNESVYADSVLSVTDTSSIFDDTPDDATEATSAEDDNLPHPRPFETPREFFQRTGNEWQEILMMNLRWKGLQPESISVKEIKSKAFELSEEKWWDCREEIVAMEEEQEAAGMGEIVSLADRGETGGAGRRR